MKKDKMLPLYSAIIICSICAYTLYGAENQEAPVVDEQTVIALTPDQLDDSLHIDKQDLALDHALGLNINTDIDPIETKEFAVEEPVIETTMPKSQPSPRSPELESPVETITPPTKIISVRKNNHNFPMPSHIPASEEERIEFQFEDASLETLLLQISELFKVTFITDDMITPLPKGGKSVKGNKITFKTNTPFTRSQAWNLFLTFLDIAELVVVPEVEPNVLRIMPTEAARKAPIPSFIGVKPETLPDSDQLIRYVYFIENTPLTIISGIVDSLRSSASSFIKLNDYNGFVLTDKALNIKSLMNIITELDKSSIPQSMSVLKLRRADATEVQKLYASLVSGEDTNITARLFPSRKQPTSRYFPEIRIIAEPRTNALILLGAADSIKKMEEFILKYVDVELGAEMLSPLRVYKLKYADANSVAAIMNETAGQFAKGTIVGNTGGVRDGDKYIKSLTFTPEPSTNTLVIKGEEEDFLQARPILERLDTPQPQVAVEVLILTVDLADIKELGTQMRSKIPGIEGLVGPNVKFQTANIGNVITNTTGAGVQRLLGNLIALVTPGGGVPGVIGGQGQTVATFGTDANGVWGIFHALESIANTEVISNPFLLATNKQRATVSVGEERRVVTNQVISGTTPFSSLSDLSALLKVVITPQINSDGMIVLDVNIDINEFTDANNPESARMRKRNITTTSIVADKEVLALGGLIRNNIVERQNKTPILGNIPILGWLFKNKHKEETKQSLLVLISSTIIPPETPQQFTDMTQKRIKDYHEALGDMKPLVNNRDPVHRFFFAEKKHTTEQILDDFIFDRQHENSPLVASNIEAKHQLIKQQNIAQVEEHGVVSPGVDDAPIVPLEVEQAIESVPLSVAHTSRSKKSLKNFLSDSPVRATA